MTAFELWAPFAENVTLQLRELVVPMNTDADGTGWFRADVPAAHGDPYVYDVDGHEVPDPRGVWLRDDITGPTLVYDHERFDWPDERWRPRALRDAVFYELHVGTFTPGGTFRSTVERLDHLVSLGVTHVELMPVAAFAGRHGWGYDGVLPFAPHPAYGSPDDLKALVAALHEQGLAVVLDVVYNHPGPVGNVLGRLGPYFTDRYATTWGAAVNVDGPGSDEVRRFFIDNTLMWLRDFHLDGVRLDAVHAIVDASASPFLEELGAAVRTLEQDTGRRLVVIAESDANDPRLVRPIEAGGLGLDAHWCDDVHHAVHAVLTGERDGYYVDFGRPATLVDALGHGYVYRGRWSAFRQRTHGREPVGVTGDQLVVCMQNHDQVGNRARGERIHHLASVAHAQVGAALVLLSPFVPLLFQGEEWAASTPFPYFADHDGELAEQVRAGRLAEFEPFGWTAEDVLDPEDEKTFRAAVLRWDELTVGEHSTMLAWYRELLALRAAHAELRDPTLPAQVELDGGAIVLRRGPFTIVANIGDDPCGWSGGPDAEHTVVLASRAVEQRGSQLAVPGWTAVVLERC